MLKTFRDVKDYFSLENQSKLHEVGNLLELPWIRHSFHSEMSQVAFVCLNVESWWAEEDIPRKSEPEKEWRRWISTHLPDPTVRARWVSSLYDAKQNVICYLILSDMHDEAGIYSQAGRLQTDFLAVCFLSLETWSFWVSISSCVKLEFAQG